VILQKLLTGNSEMEIFIPSTKQDEHWNHDNFVLYLFCKPLQSCLCNRFRLERNQHTKRWRKKHFFQSSATGSRIPCQTSTMTSLVHTTTANRKLWSRYHDEAPDWLKCFCRNGPRRLHLEVEACCKRMPCL